MSCAKSIERRIAESSPIRKMFEAAAALRAQFGSENIFDLSLGNPLLDPPQAVRETLARLCTNPQPGMHRYVANNGLPRTRAAVAREIENDEGIGIHADDVIMTVGAAGAMNVALRALLDPGDEVIVIAPYFVEYPTYIELHGGKALIVESAANFTLDLVAIDRAITDKTKIVVINSPNNPTGHIYSSEQLDGLAQLLAVRKGRAKNAIYLLADTPYAKIVYDGTRTPPIFARHPHTIRAHSYSKELGLAGERIGYLAIHPQATHRQQLRDALTLCNRVLGFVSAPVLMQRTLEHSLEARVDSAFYQDRRDQLCDGLSAAGYRFATPQGGFFVFAKTPIDDDIRFTEQLVRENILVVPGRAFGRRGHIRLSFSVEAETIAGALPGLARAFSMP